MASKSTFPIKNDKGLSVSALNPKYLHTNSTSHTWPFSAIAELIDNAYDPDVNASQLWIDLKSYDTLLALTFTDNGNGMDLSALYKMLSFGFCEKVTIKGHMPVGHYGNGFKSGSMRLGKDAIVFTKQEDTCCIGFLSQSYLEETKAETIVVPILQWDQAINSYVCEDGAESAMALIFKHSIVKDARQIQDEFNAIPGSSGTRIIIFNLRKAGDQQSEFDFTSDIRDILIPSDDESSAASSFKKEQRQHHIPASDYSLRAYCSILYLKPKMQIILRGQKVKTCVIAKSLSKTEIDTYRPTGSAKSVKIVFGFSQNKDHYGIMMYHRNRLIKPYVRVGYQLKANNLGVGVIGVIECNYLQPTHNKQDFDYTESYRTCMASLGIKLNEYWQEKKQSGKNKLPAVSVAIGDASLDIPDIAADDDVVIVPDELWVQCDNPKCLKWRKMPPGSDASQLPEKWFCSQHPLVEWQSCSAPEESYWGEDNEVKPYVKEVKRKLAREKEQQKKTMAKNKKKEADRLENERKRQIEAAVAKQQEAARIKKENEEASTVMGKKVQSVPPLASGQRLRGASLSAVVSQSATATTATSSSPASILMHVKPSGSQLFSSALAKNALKTGKPVDVKTSTGRSAKLLYIATPQQLSAAGGKTGSVTLKPLLNIAGQNLLYSTSSSTTAPTAVVMTTTASSSSSLGVTSGSLQSVTSQSVAVGQPTQLILINQQTGSKMAILSPVGTNALSSGAQPQAQVGIVTAQARQTPGLLQVVPSSVVSPSNPKPLTIVSAKGAGAGTSALVQINRPATTASLTQLVTPSVSQRSIAPVSSQVDTPALDSSEKSPKSSERQKRRSSADTPAMPSRRSKRTKTDEKSDGERNNIVPSAVNGSAIKPELQSTLNDLRNADKDIIKDVDSYPIGSYRGKLVKRSQQLRDLRRSVCCLLAILVPDLALPDLEKKSLDDDTLDALLKQVLDANAEDTG